MEKVRNFLEKCQGLTAITEDDGRSKKTLKKGGRQSAQQSRGGSVG